MLVSRTAVMLALAALGLALGLVVGTKISGPRNASLESYLAMAATLYAEGESIDNVTERLAWLKGYDLPATMQALAEKYERSSDPQKVRQAVPLRRLSDAMATPKTKPAATPVPSPAAKPPTPAVTTPAPVVSVVVPTPTFALPTGGRTLLNPSQLPRSALIKPEGGGPSNLRSKPATKDSSILRVLPNETKVTVKRVVDGEAVTPGEPWWYELEVAGTTGFVYYKLVEW